MEDVRAKDDTREGSQLEPERAHGQEGHACSGSRVSASHAAIPHVRIDLGGTREPVFLLDGKCPVCYVCASSVVHKLKMA